MKKAWETREKPISQKILCVEKNEVFESVIKAAECFSVSVKAIYAVCDKENKKSCGFHWKYYEETKI